MTIDDDDDYVGVIHFHFSYWLCVHVLLKSFVFSYVYMINLTIPLNCNNPIIIVVDAKILQVIQ